MRWDKWFGVGAGTAYCVGRCEGSGSGRIGQAVAACHSRNAEAMLKCVMGFHGRWGRERAEDEEGARVEG